MICSVAYFFIAWNITTGDYSTVAKCEETKTNSYYYELVTVGAKDGKKVVVIDYDETSNTVTIKEK